MALTITQDDLASPAQRLGAFLLDCLIFVPPMILVFFLSWDFDSESGGVVVTTWWPSVVLGLIAAVYEVVGVAVWGRTVGKLLVHIRVCSDQDLGRPGCGRALIRWGLRWAVGWVPIVGSLLTILVVLPLVWTQKRQGLHDMAAGTLVVRDGV